MRTTLTKDSTAAETSAETQADVRVIIFRLAADDPEPIYDLRANNERHKNMAYDSFWDE